MSYSELPEWPDSALNSLGLVYRELQDIEIYVEDKDSEALYRELLTRSTNSEVNVKKIICLNGRINVVNKCRNYEEDFPALFVIDGDMELLHGEREEPLPRLYQHEVYCVENYIFCPEACVQILMESSGKLVKEDAVNLLKWEEFLGEIDVFFIQLFVAFAISWKLMPQERTVANTFYRVSIEPNKKRGQVVCPIKIQELIDEIEKKAVSLSCQNTYDGLKSSVEVVIGDLSDPLQAISGKDFLIPALYHYLKYKGVINVTMDSFKFRLARHCNVEGLSKIGEVIKRTVGGEIYHAV